MAAAPVLEVSVRDVPEVLHELRETEALREALREVLLETARAEVRMSRQRDDGRGRVRLRTAAFATVLALLLGALLALAPAPAAAQGDALVLARTCLHEVGWRAYEDCAAIDEVLRGVARRAGLSYRAAAYAYAGQALRGRTSRPWAAEVDATGERPLHWPARLPWDRYRPLWLALLDEARAIVAGLRDVPCAGVLDDWGGRVDRARARRLGLVRVVCAGDLRGDYYARPSRLRARAEGRD